LEDVFGDLKDVAEMGATTNAVEDMKNAVEDMTVAEKEAEATKNGIRNDAEEGKREQCLVIRGHS
jgi:hypothetical protein